MKNIIVYISFIIGFLLAGCEYDNDKVYYTEEERPEDITIDVNLDGLSNGQVIYIYAPTKLHYFYDLKSKKQLKHEIKLGNKIIEPDSDGVINIDPTWYADNEVLDLNINIELATGSNSIAEKLGYEKYVGNYNYKIKILKNASFILDFKEEVTVDRHLKISWTTPNLEQVEVESYEVFYSDEVGGEIKLTTITNPSQTFFIDDSYTSGYRRYLVRPYFKDNRMLWQFNYHTIQEDYPAYSMQSEPEGLDKIKIKWAKNKYRCRYVLEYLDGTIIDCGENTEMEIQGKYSFPMNKDVNLHTVPINYGGDVLRTPYSRQYISSKKIALESTPGDMDYNLNDFRLYTYEFGKLSSIDLKTMNVLRSKPAITYWDWYNKCLSYSDNLNKLAFAGREYFTIYDKNMDSISSVKVKNGFDLNPNYSIFSLTNDNRIITYTSNLIEHSLKVYNVNSNNLMYSEQLGGEQLFLSKNGDLVCIMQSFAVGYKVGDFELERVSKTPIDFFKYKNATFSQVQNEIIYIMDADNFYKLNILTGEKTSPIQGQFITEDPFTGNVVYTKSDGILTISNFELDDVLFSLPAETLIPPMLYNNILISAIGNSFYYLDLNSYLKK